MREAPGVRRSTRSGFGRMRLAGWMLTVLCAVPAGAQPDWYSRWRPDSLEVARDAVPIPMAAVWTDCDPPGTQVVRDSADAAQIRRFSGCDPLPFPALGRELYVRVVMMGDCHARHSVDAFRSDSRREYRMLVVDRYGGCRAGRIREQWYRLPPLPEGWTVAFTERRIDQPGRVTWSTDSLDVAEDAVPLPAEWEWIDCDPGDVRVLRDRVDAEAIRHAPGCDPSAFPALGRDLYVRVLPGPVCDAPVRRARLALRASRRVPRRPRAPVPRLQGAGRRPALVPAPAAPRRVEGGVHGWMRDSPRAAAPGLRVTRR